MVSVGVFVSVERPDGLYQLYKTANPPETKNLYKGSAASAEFKTNITRVENKIIYVVLLATPLGEEVAIPIDNPVKAKYAAKALKIPFDKVYLPQKTDNCKVIEDYTLFSSPTSSRNTYEL